MATNFSFNTSAATTSYTWPINTPIGITINSNINYYPFTHTYYPYNYNTYYDSCYTFNTVSVINKNQKCCFKCKNFCGQRC